MSAYGSRPGTGGVITSSTNTGLLVTNGGGTYAGAINGTSVNFAKVAGGTMALGSAINYGGATTISGTISRFMRKFP